MLVILKNMQTITFNRKLREQQKDPKGQVVQHERNYFDFIVSGQSVKTLLKADGLDLISPFGWGDKNYEQELIKEFTGLKRSEIPSGRIMLYICPECGDIGCGAITADIEINDDKVIWKNFGYENNDSEIDFESYKGIEPFQFDKADYLTKFGKLIS